MLRHDSIYFLLIFRMCNHYKLLIIAFIKQLMNSIIISLIIKSWCSCQSSQTVTSFSITYVLISSMNLGPCFFNYSYPKLLWFLNSTIYQFIILCQQLIINIGGFRFSINKSVHLILPIFSILLFWKNIFNSLRMLGYSTERPKQITGITITLFDILRLKFE